MRVRVCGDRILTMDGKPFRKTDLSPREELAELRTELARLEDFDRMTTLETKQEFPELSSTNRIEELKSKIRSIEYWFNDSAAPPPAAIVTVADLNKRNAQYWENRR